MPNTSFKSMYISNVEEINKLQNDIMLFVTLWTRTYKTPVPQREIVKAMAENKTKDFTTLNALNTLLKKGYVRKSSGYGSRFTQYTQLRTV